MKKQTTRPFYKTIRFTLTFWYTGMFFVLGIIMLLSINFLVAQVLSRSSINPNLLQRLIKQRGNHNPMMTLQFKEQKRLQAIRNYDLAYIRRASWWILLPLSIFSTLGGWYIAGRSLQPINKLNEITKQIKLDNLQISLPNREDNDDEISELINNFNKMQRRLFAANESQKSFIGDAAHELKTPLAIIHTTLDDLIDDSQISPIEIKRVLTNLKKNILNLNQLMEDLLLLAQNNSLNYQSINLETVIKNAVQSVQSLLNSVGGQIHIDSLKKPILIQGNHTLLVRMVSNLLENSIKYRDPDRILQVTIKLLRKRSIINLSIKDNGIGMTSPQLNRAFDRFYRGEGSRSRLTGGSGLGLSIVKKIIESHAGSVTIESKLGEGTILNIVFSARHVNNKK